MDINKYLKGKLSANDFLHNHKIATVEEIILKEEEIVESALDPVHKNLNENIFDSNNDVKDNVNKFIIDNFFKWWDKLGNSSDQIKEFILIGSITGYQYSVDSDIDININTSLSDSEINQYANILPNGNLLFDTQHPINYYLTNNLEAVEKADSAYNLTKNKWIKKPEIDETEVPYLYSLEIAKFFMDGIDERILEYERDIKELEMYKSYLSEEEVEVNKDEIEKLISIKEQEVKADLDAVYAGHKLLRAFRNEGFNSKESPDFLIQIRSKSPNKSIENLVYKIMEKFGYLDKVSKYENLRKQYEEK